MGEKRTWDKRTSLHWPETVKFFMGIYSRKYHSPKYRSSKYEVPGHKSIAVESRRAYFSDGMELRIYKHDRDLEDLDFPGLWGITKGTKTQVEVVYAGEVEGNYPDIDEYILAEKTARNTVCEIVLPSEYLCDDTKDWASITLWRIAKCVNNRTAISAPRFCNAFNAIGKAELTVTVLRDGIVLLENFMFQVVLMPISMGPEEQTKACETF
jgi:hypothetical protein